MEKFYVDGDKFIGVLSSYTPKVITRDENGVIISIIDGPPVFPTPPEGAIEVQTAPPDGRDTYDPKTGQYTPHVEVAPPIPVDGVLAAVITVLKAKAGIVDKDIQDALNAQVVAQAEVIP